jgi:hypothetical protein
VRIEYRLNTATKVIFTNHHGTYDKQQSTVTLGWAYSI